MKLHGSGNGRASHVNLSSPAASPGETDTRVFGNFYENVSPRNPLPSSAVIRGVNSLALTTAPTAQSRRRRNTSYHDRWNSNSLPNAATTASMGAVNASLKEIPCRGGSARWSRRSSTPSLSGRRSLSRGASARAQRNERISCALPATFGFHSTFTDRCHCAMLSESPSVAHHSSCGRQLPAAGRGLQTAAPCSCAQFGLLTEFEPSAFMSANENLECPYNRLANPCEIFSVDDATSFLWNDGRQQWSLFQYSSSSRTSSGFFTSRSSGNRSRIPTALNRCRPRVPNSSCRPPISANQQHVHEPKHSYGSSVIDSLLRLPNVHHSGVGASSDSDVPSSTRYSQASAYGGRDSCEPSQEFTSLVSKNERLLLIASQNTASLQTSLKSCNHEALLNEFSASSVPPSSFSRLEDCFSRVNANNPTAANSPSNPTEEEFESSAEPSGCGLLGALGWGNRHLPSSEENNLIVFDDSSSDYECPSLPITAASNRILTVEHITHKNVIMPANRLNLDANRSPELVVSDQLGTFFGDEMIGSVVSHRSAQELACTTAVNRNSNVLFNPFDDLLPSPAPANLPCGFPLQGLLDSSQDILQPKPLPANSVSGSNHVSNAPAKLFLLTPSPVLASSASVSDTTNNSSGVVNGLPDCRGSSDEGSESQIGISKGDLDSTEVYCHFKCNRNNVADVLFIPCEHRVVCSKCVGRAFFSRCSVCYEPIRGAKNRKGEYVYINGANVEMLTEEEAQQMLNEAVEEAKRDVEKEDKYEIDALVSELARLEGGRQCVICASRRSTVLFECGHTVCSWCDRPDEATRCLVCKLPVQHRTVLFS